MKTYGQYCAVARALDIVGDRWTLLIVRELLLGPRRFGELHERLPGIATNLLTTRLRNAEAHGIVRRDGGAYLLTEDGEALRPVMGELVRWGDRFMERLGPEDEFHSGWLALALRALLPVPERACTVQLDTGDEPIAILARDGEFDVRLGVADTPDATVSGPPDAVLGYLAGRLSQTAARQRGVAVTGDRSVVAAMRA